MKSAISILSVFTIAACTSFAADMQPATPSAGAAALQAIRYERNGGFAGTHDVIEITPAGEVIVEGKLLKSGKTRLTAAQSAQLAALFGDWKAFKGAYPAPAGTADAFEYKIRYGTLEVTGSDANRELPAAFKSARDALEKIAQTVQPK